MSDVHKHLCYSRNHVEIIYKPSGSHAATHFEDTPELKPAVIETLGAMTVEGPQMYFEHDLGRVIGTTDLVETTDADEIVYAKRKNRDVYTRFTTSQPPQDCSTVTISLHRINDYQYLLWSAWLGYKGLPFPGDASETPESRAYWSKHALVWGRQEIQAGTETSETPWHE